MALTQKAEVFLDLPGGTLSREARVEIVGARLVTVDGACDILEYDTGRVRLKTRGGEVCITGDELRMDSLYDGGASVSGCVATVEFS
ncbi:MAG: YabP/YqfC family sporulation protein [Clostridia bacterium]|nr:YabP/YqfC family sporulation protein [Clostridia bacterium]